MFNTIRSLVHARSGSAPEKHDKVELSEFAPWLESPCLQKYLTTCLPKETYAASGMRVKSIRGLLDELLGSPGVDLRERGYLVIASSIGGNAICVDINASVFWADHSSFYRDLDLISFEDRSTGNWIKLPFNDQNIRAALIPLSHDFPDFMTQLLHDKLESKLDELD